MWPGIPGETRVLAKRDKRAPQRGSLVVFKYPEHREQSFAKRVIGSAGDVVEQDAEGALSINGWKIPRCMVGKGAFTDPSTTGVAGPEQHQGTLYVEWLGAWTHLVFEDESAPASAPHRWTVAEGQYFVVGDNRRNSHDSRTWYGGEGGGVPYADTIGIVQGHGGVALPANLRGNEKLEAGLSACLAKQPDAASPPAQ
jgi:signal peptidase I